jgi:Family of unknown function (DUF6343)
MDLRVVSSSSRTTEKSAATSTQGSALRTGVGTGAGEDTDGMNEPHRPRSRRDRDAGPVDYSKGLPDHHDPTAGIGGAAPAQSALTLRLVLAAFGLVFCLGAGLLWLSGDALPVWPAVVLFVLAAAAAVDLVVVARRKRRGEPG